MTVGEMKQKKLEKGYSYAQIAELSGIPLGTVQKIFSGETEHPRYSTLKALEQVFMEQDDSMMLCDSAAVYGDGPQKGAGDQPAVPEDIRVELIDGAIYEMEVPTFGHQKIAGEIYRQIANYIMDQNGACEVAAAPVGVQLDCDGSTMVQPDVVILCEHEKIINGRVFGAPDFVLEVASPSTRRKDMFIKLAKYESAGVREYWILDPCNEQLIVFFFEGDIYAQRHDLAQPVAINIYGGRLAIRFEHILKWCSEI